MDDAYAALVDEPDLVPRAVVLAAHQCARQRDPVREHLRADGI